jgi:hypothetical protein
MTLHHPVLLLLWLLIPALLYLRYARRRQTVVRFSDGISSQRSNKTG